MHKIRYIYIQVFLVIFILIIAQHKLWGLKPKRYYFDSPGTMNAYEEVTFYTADNKKLTGWFFLSPDTILSHLVRKPTIIIAGGDAGNMSQLLWYTNVSTIGVNVLLFDYRGFGQSETFFIDTTALIYPEFLLDLEAAINYVKTRKDVDTTTLGVLGISMGSILAVPIAAVHPEIKALVLDGIATNTKEVIEVLKKQKKFKNLKIYVPSTYPCDKEPINTIKYLDSCAVFIIVGEKDINTPLWMAKKIYNAAPIKKDLWIVKGAKHGMCPHADPVKYMSRVRKFFYNNLMMWKQANDK